MTPPNHKSNIKKRRGKKSPLKYIIYSVLAVIIIFGAIVAFRAFSTPDIDSPLRIYIASGSDKEQVMDSLRAHLPEAYVNNVEMCLDYFGHLPESRKGGSYVVDGDTKAWQLMRRIQNRAQSPVVLKIVFARNIEEVAKIIDRQLEMSADDFIKTADSVYSSRNIPSEMYPAMIIPDQHEFYWTASADEVMGRFDDSYEAFWTAEREAKAKKLGLSRNQVSILASIVAGETYKADEMPDVARLYINRLNKGMKLQADPTVKFAVSDFSLRRITGKHLMQDSPYNTYKYRGLPPGPISVPSKQYLDAVLNAPDHAWLYMCAKEDFSGYHNFAETYEQHKQNAKRYQQELDKRNIK